MDKVVSAKSEILPVLLTWVIVKSVDTLVINLDLDKVVSAKSKILPVLLTWVIVKSVDTLVTTQINLDLHLWSFVERLRYTVNNYLAENFW